MVFSIKIVDSKNNVLETIQCDTAKYPMGNVSYNSRRKRKERYLGEDKIRSIMQDNNIGFAYNVVRTDTYRRDGIVCSYPSVIRLVTDVADDRKLPDEHTGGQKHSPYQSEMLRSFFAMANAMYQHQE
jgi:hypothetical protein